MKTNHRLYLLSTILVVIIVSCSFFLGRYFTGNNNSALLIASAPIITSTPVLNSTVATTTRIVREVRENSPDYTFINPLLFIETDQSLFPEYAPFDTMMGAYIKSATSRSSVDSISIYFRDMNSGHWTGINEDEKYEPSSLLKVAVMIAAYKEASVQSDASAYSVDSFLSKRLYYPGPDTLGQYYVSPSNLTAGSYSYEQLIEDMIINSDNVALNTILADNQKQFNKVYEDFRLPAVVDGGATDYMTAKSYSVVFRTLYNSTYLSWDLSERLLGLLASTTFNQGIVAGVPQGTIVSHKFGEHTNLGPENYVINLELHDCGIVYYPQHPYLLCVMTKGHDFPSLEKVISTISKKTYDYVDAQQTGKKS